MRFPKLKKWQMVEIDWLDSCHLSGWNRENNIDFARKDLEHKSCGYFLKETDYSLSVIQSRKSDTSVPNISVDALMEIPKVAILKIRKLS